MDTVTLDVRDAVEELITGNVATAREALLAVDFSFLLEERNRKYSAVWGLEGVGRKYIKTGTTLPRARVSRAVVQQVFTRDSYTCRYAHCRRRTISPNILRLLAKALPDIVHHQQNWRPLDRHILFWVYSTSLEHVIPFPSGGTSEFENLITSCYECNDLKNYLPLDVLGWSVAEPTEKAWSGLTEFERPLRLIAAMGS